MEFKEYVGKPMIAWLCYNPNYVERFGGTNIVCYVYPRFLAGSILKKIDAEEDFPENGRIDVFIRSGQSAGDICKALGPLVSVRIQRDIQPNNKGYNRFRLSYLHPSADGSSHTSDISMERISGRKYYQILKTDQDYADLQSSRRLPVPDAGVFTDCVLVRTGEKLYGPFSCTLSEESLTLSGSKDFQYRVGEYPVPEDPEQTAVVTDPDGKAAVALLQRSALPDPLQTFDWIRDEELVAAFANALRAGSHYTRGEIRKISENAETLLSSLSAGEFTEERKMRLRALMKEFGAWTELSDALLEQAVRDDTAKAALAAVAVERHLDEIQDRLMEHEGIRKHIEDLRREETRLRDSVDSLLVKEKDLQSRLPAPESTESPDALDTAIRERKDALKVYDKKLRDAQAQYAYELNQKQKLDESLAAMLRQYKDEAGQITRLFDASVLRGLLRGSGGPAAADASPSSGGVQPSDTSQTPGGAQTPAAPRFQPAPLHAPMSRDELIDRVHDFLCNRAGRGIRRNDTINYLICLSQSFLTTFAGSPGVGKTSLCDLLARSLGLATGNEFSRYIEIPVESGWNAPADFIGIWNPAANAADIRNMEAWEAMERLTQEWEAASRAARTPGSAPAPRPSRFAGSAPVSRAAPPSRTGSASGAAPAAGTFPGYAPFLFLLDEANLSPIERYWSPFLRLCDRVSGASRSISIGGGRSWHLPDYVRFLATVNFDSTREPLPSRFLDRSWIITLDSFPIADNPGENPGNLGDMVPYASLQSAFAPSGSGMDRETAEKWDAVQNLFRARNLPIVPRNQAMVRDYCAVACACMERGTAETRLAPLDYAISQKILPTVNGTGDACRELFYDLRRECPENLMPLTAKHLERIQRAADRSHGVYRFFAE